jgi:hypothetical protein
MFESLGLGTNGVETRCFGAGASSVFSTSCAKINPAKCNPKKRKISLIDILVSCLLWASENSTKSGYKVPHPAFSATGKKLSSVSKSVRSTNMARDHWQMEHAIDLWSRVQRVAEHHPS